jgi:hypothetical protein
MFATFWGSALLIMLALAGSLALRPLAARWARGTTRIRGARVVAAVRLCLVIAAVILAQSLLVNSSSGLPWPLRSVLWAAGALCALPWFSNAVAGLWLLSPFSKAGPGDFVVACGQPGRIVGYGITRLELEAEAGWTAHLPYVAVVCRPLLVSNQVGARASEFTLKRSDWTDDKVQFLRQAAILAPYRALESKVHVARRVNLVSVRLVLTRPGSEKQMQHFLEAAVADYDPNRAHLGIEDALNV